jgi:hypothetical protein
MTCRGARAGGAAAAGGGAAAGADGSAVAGGDSYVARAATCSAALAAAAGELKPRELKRRGDAAALCPPPRSRGLQFSPAQPCFLIRGTSAWR